MANSLERPRYFPRPSEAFDWITGNRQDGVLSLYGEQCPHAQGTSVNAVYRPPSVTDEPPCCAAADAGIPAPSVPMFAVHAPATTAADLRRVQARLEVRGKEGLDAVTPVQYASFESMGLYLHLYSGSIQ